MAQQQRSNRPTKNLILSALPTDEYHRLAPHLEPVSLSQGQVIYDASEPIRLVYFPTSGMFSLLATTTEGEITEVAMVDNEGMIGMPIVWGSDTTPYRVMAQITGSALAMKATRLQGQRRVAGAAANALWLRQLGAVPEQVHPQSGDRD